MGNYQSLIHMHLRILFKEIILNRSALKGQSGNALKIKGMSIDEFDNINDIQTLYHLIPIIISQAKSIVSENDIASGGRSDFKWNGYFYSIHSKNIRDSLKHLEPLLEKMHEKIDLIKFVRDQNYIDVNLINDHSLKKIVSDLNLAYILGIDSAIFPLVRKLVENLIIDKIKSLYPNQDNLWKQQQQNIVKILPLKRLINNLFNDPNLFSNIHISTYSSTISTLEDLFLEIPYMTNPTIHSAYLFPNSKQIKDLKKTTESILHILSKV